MINQLSEGSKDILLECGLWGSGKLPENWKEAVIIPKHRSGKYGTKTGKYRLIALTNLRKYYIKNMSIHWIVEEWQIDVLS